MQMVRTACRFRLHGAAEPPLKRMSGEIYRLMYSMQQRDVAKNVHKYK